MGRLKDRLTSLAKLMAELDSEADVFAHKNQTLRTSTLEAIKAVKNDYDALYLRLIENAKKKGQLSSHNTIKDLFDPEIGKIIKDLEVKKPVAFTHAAELRTLTGDVQKLLLAKLGKAESDLAQITEMTNKRKKKLIQSKKFKDKIQIYETQTKEIQKSTNEIKTYFAADAKYPAPDPKRYSEKLTVATTLAEIRRHLSDELKEDLLNAGKASQEATKFRKTNLAKQLGVIKTWATEADEMEAESN